MRIISKGMLRRFGLLPPKKLPPDFDERTVKILSTVKPYTMTSPERVFSLIQAVDYVVNNNIEGSIVECGVWKGGSAMTIAAVLKEHGDERELYLYDTYEGMTAPTKHDVSVSGQSARDKFDKLKTSDNSSEWCFSSLNEVKANLKGFQNIHFIQGKVEDTIPETMPEKISLLRLDTDFYESTKHELDHLFPLLSPGGVIIIDDYGHWQGSKKAVDEYWKEHNISVLLNRIDESGRIGVITPLRLS